MIYWLWLVSKENGAFVHRDGVLPGVVPSHVMERLTVGFADEMDLCNECGMASRCHIIGPGGAKYCTVLFHDAIRPEWKLEDVA